MRVVCRKIVSGGADVETHPSITIGRSYLVIALTHHPGTDPELIVVGDTSYPSQWPAEMFVTDDGSIPSNWKVHVQATGHVNVAPASWLRPDFWTHFYGSSEGMPAERQQSRMDYDRELQIIAAEDSGERRNEGPQ